MFEHFTEISSDQDQTRESVMTSLSYLLSSRVPLAPSSLSSSLELFRYGMPSLFTPLCDVAKVCSDLKTAILFFEPRIETLTVEAVKKSDGGLSIIIEGWLCSEQQSTPIRYILD